MKSSLTAMPTKRVAIVGAGPVGLCTIKCMKEENIEPVCFERTAFYGGLWRYHDDDVEGLASVMKSTVINSSKELGSLSDFPADENAPNYMHHTEVINALTEMCVKLDLLKHVHFNKEIVNIDFSNDYEVTGRFIVTTKDTKNGDLASDTFDGVFVCIGHHVYPNVPSFPGQEKFKGKILHTHSLKTVEGLKDQVVVVVGVGNSGMDAAVEASSVAKHVLLSTRRGAWVFPRLGPSGLPFDLAFTTRFLYYLFILLPYNLTCMFMESILDSRFDHSKYNIKPKHRALSQHPSVSDILPVKLLCGTVKMKTNIKTFTEKGIIFENDIEETEVDSVILATGYQIKFPFINKDIFKSINNEVYLYKRMYPPHLKHHTLAFLGLFQSIGAGFPLCEAQGRLSALVLNRKITLPQGDEMEKGIQKDIDEVKKKFVPTARHTIQVNYIGYCDEISEMFGAKPNLWKIFVTDPILWYVLMFGPSLPYQYRLQGPHPWSGARKAILDYKRRVQKPLRDDVKKQRPNFPIIVMSLMFVLLGAGLLLLL